ncbi:MAG: hypothetical protein KatS3mg088_442 [Patescibacteria group bacterium]|nr:MAG: hypothetical protein KatS3mg088_442 [Patescibacteria group bacterium]
MKMLDSKSVKFAFLSSFFLILTMYTGFAQRLFVPVFFFFLVLFNLRKLFKVKKIFLIFSFLSFLFVLPLIYVSLFQGASTRFKMVFIANDINYVRYVIFGYASRFIDYCYLFFFWIKRYLNYLQPRFLFSDALQMVLPGNIGLGILYPFEGLFLVFGIFELIKRRILHKDMLLIWLFTGIVPDSITNNEQHAGRLLHIAPLIFTITTLGAVSLWRLLNKKVKGIKSFFILSVLVAFSVLNILFAWLLFRVHFPYQKSEAFDEGWREVVYSVMKYQDNYEKIIFDIRRGVDGPYMVSNPHMYLLFYSKYDPSKYQTIKKVFNVYGDSEPYFAFDKYSFGYINWYRDSKYKNTLLVGSPWSFPKEEDLGNKLIEKIYLSNGKPAFYLVSTE